MMNSMLVVLVLSQMFVADPINLPPAIPVSCQCMPTNGEDIETTKAVLTGAVKNFENCIIFGENEWGEPAGPETCGRGQVLVHFENQAGVWYYQGLGVELPSGKINVDNVEGRLLYYSLPPESFFLPPE